jgi:methylated-DNA-[protein]-cysteine S-methyltransferase
MNDPPFFHLRVTPFGPVAVLWSAARGRPEVRRILISRPANPAGQAVSVISPNAVPSSCLEVDGLLDRIESFLNGEDIRFSLEAVRLDLCSPFQRSVLLAEYAIPRGSVSTYSLIARHLGNPKGARAVGTALATNPFPLVIPCHRAIRSDGSLGGYQGGLGMKHTLLAMEGVAFCDENRVAIRTFHYGGPP